VLPLRVLILAQARRGRLFGLLLLGLGAVFHASTAPAQESHFVFNIPAQALDTALEAYGGVSGRDVLYHSNLAIGRRSNAVLGQLPPDTALAILLEGTGLSARYESSGSYVLQATPSAADPPLPPNVGRYYARIQTALRTALCVDNQVRPGTYRVAVRLWIDTEGSVLRHERLSSAGEPGLNDAIDRKLRNLRIGAPPPTGLAQPLTIVILPQGDGATVGCDVHETRAAR
jgi:Secretin and TonB N terminus short domain/TonB C terminal